MPRSSAVADVDTPVSPHSPESVTALLVDADRSFVQFAREELDQRHGVPVRLLHAETLAEAEARLSERHDVAVVLLDEQTMNGDAASWIRRQRLRAAVLLLASHDSGGVVPCEPGLQGRLVKARIDGEHLAQEIREAARRERTRQALMAAPEQLQALIAHVRDVLLVLDGDGRVVYQSPSTATTFGVTPQALCGRPFAAIVHPEDASQAEVLVRVALGEGGSPRGEIRIPHADGGMRSCEVTGARLPQGTSSAQVVLNLRDITDVQRAEAALQVRDAQLQQAQRLEAVGRLAGGIAHDFNNVLAVIAGACERIELAGVGGEAGREDAQLALRHCARATALTRQLLAFSRHERIVPHAIDLGDVVQGASDLLARLLGSGVRVSCAIDAGLPRVEADPVQMEQVLMNLAINARDAMPEGGALRISVRSVTATAALCSQNPGMTPGPYVELEVADEGQGMSPDVQARMFEPFFTTKAPTRGTGLGLATVSGIVAQAGGYVGVTSRIGRGTRMSVYLPAVRETLPVPVPAPPTAEAMGRLQQATVLVVDDDEDVRAIVSAGLRPVAGTVLEAAGPADALAAVAALEAPVDVLVTDVTMPGGSGHALAGSLSHQFPALRVLYISGLTRASDGPGAPPLTARILAKPFTRRQLCDAVADLFA